MLGFVKWLYLMALIVWVGEVVCFSLIVAPALFRALPSEEAGRAVSTIFPLYYRVGSVCGLILLLTNGMLFAAATGRLWWSVNAVLIAIMLGATLYAGLIVQPRATALRPQLHAENAPADVKPEFDRLHRLAVQLNGAVLLCGVAMSVVTATALRP